MRNEAMKSKMLYDRPLPVQRIVSTIADSKTLEFKIKKGEASVC